ncbi:MAG: ABC transporter substrate-binding protein [Rhodoferax sp.]|uniref:ABC transporter substrate-binding protein n=1 Tax=Rhodoferax sp. TaxID=50421 RepID=UPI00326706B5
MNRRLWLAALLLVGCLTGCGPPKAIHLGFIGSLSDRGSDTGQDGRNGMILAVEQRNQAGGIHGRMVEIQVQDDGMQPDKSQLAIQALVSAHVDAIVGPFSSAMATVVVPISNQAGIVMVSPNVTSTDFVGKDDFLIRINRTTRDNANEYAQLLYQRGQHRMALAYDTRNASYSLAWLSAFKVAYAALGGQVVAAVAYESDARTGFGDVVRQMLAQPSQGLLFIGSAIDVARLAQQAEKQAPQIPKSAAERASTELLLELGGRSVEGLLIAQAFNRDDPSERYRSFHSAFVARFAREPGFSAVLSYDATRVLCEAMATQLPGQSLKDSILQHGPYQGLQQDIQFDRFGDTARKVFFTEVRGGKFVLLK